MFIFPVTWYKNYKLSIEIVHAYTNKFYHVEILPLQIETILVINVKSKFVVYEILKCENLFRENLILQNCNYYYLIII